MEKKESKGIEKLVQQLETELQGTEHKDLERRISAALIKHLLIEQQVVEIEQYVKYKQRYKAA